MFSSLVGAGSTTQGSPRLLRHAHSTLSAPTITANTQGDSQSRTDVVRDWARPRAATPRAHDATFAEVATDAFDPRATAASDVLSGSPRASSRLQRSTANSVDERPRVRPLRVAEALTR